MPQDFYWASLLITQLPHSSCCLFTKSYRINTLKSKSCSLAGRDTFHILGSSSLAISVNEKKGSTQTFAKHTTIDYMHIGL